MDFNSLLNQFQNANIIYLFFKAFAVLFAFLYLVYSLVLLKQTQVMNKTVDSSGGAIIVIISFVQLVLGAILVLLAIYSF